MENICIGITKSQNGNPVVYATCNGTKYIGTYKIAYKLLRDYEGDVEPIVKELKSLIDKNYSSEFANSAKYDLDHRNDNYAVAMDTSAGDGDWEVVSDYYPTHKEATWARYNDEEFKDGYCRVIKIGHVTCPNCGEPAFFDGSDFWCDTCNEPVSWTPDDIIDD